MGAKKDHFVVLVQTAAIVESLTREPGHASTSRGMNAAMAVDAALKVQESQLPDDLAEACELFLDYYFSEQSGEAPHKPIWLQGII